MWILSYLFTGSPFPSSCPVMCSFEDGICGYTMPLARGGVQWMVSSGYSTQASMAPQLDFDGSALGHFAYVSGPEGQVMRGPAQLRGPVFRKSAASCTIQVHLQSSFAHRYRYGYKAPLHVPVHGMCFTDFFQCAIAFIIYNVCLSLTIMSGFVYIMYYV